MMTMHKWGLTLAMALTVSAGLMGCGGSKRLSRDELIAKADPICARANQTLKAEALTPHNTATEAPKLAALYQSAADELTRLTPPSSMTADWKLIVDKWRTAASGLSELGQAARVKDATKELAAEGMLSKAQQDRSVIAERNGFAQCARY